MKHIGGKIVLLVVIAEIAAMLILFIFLNGRLSGMLEDRVISDMGIIAHHRADLAETYIKGRCDFLEGYSRSTEAIRALSDPENPEYIQAARDYTNRYAAGYDDLEGIYIAEWDTYVLAHSNPESMDKTFRDAAGAKELEDLVRANRTAFCTGIVLAPVTKKMVMPVYAPVFDEKGEMVGFAGAAFYPEAIGVQLEVNEDLKYDYTIINCNDHNYIYDAKNADLPGTECADEALWATVEEIKAQTGPDKQGSMISNGLAMSIYYMPDNDWIFMVSEPVSEVFEFVKTVRKTAVFVFIPVTLLLVLIVWLVISRMMAPIEKINSQIIRLEAADFSRGHGIEKYMSRRDEFGTISRAVMQLHSTLEHQDELFREILDSQTAGTVVAKDLNREVILINQTALKLYDISTEEKDTVTIEDIRSRFSEDELAYIDEQVKKVTALKNEVVFESSLTHRDGTQHCLLTRVRSVILSNGERVSIYSLMDISSQKRKDENH